MIEIVTAVNLDLWRRYAETTTSTWSQKPRIYWQPHDTTDKWREWREKNHPLHSEPKFQKTWQRFSHKVEAQCELYKQTKHSHRWMIWLDADVRQLAEPANWQDLLPPEGTAIAYLSRGDDYHPETGYIAYDCQDPRLDAFFTRLEQVYLTDEIFTLKEWHDAWVWDWVCRDVKIKRHTLIEGTPRRGEAFGRSRLSPYFEHLKGPRKEQVC